MIADFGGGLQVLRGPYGPYVTDGKKNARIPKEIDPEKLTEEKPRSCWPRRQTAKGRFATAAKR